MTGKIDIRIETAAWQGALGDAAAVCREAAVAAVAVAPPPWRGAAISVLLADDATLQSLNRAYRGRDEATNVLSFPLVDPGHLKDDGPPLAEDGALLGDVAVAFGITAHEANEAKKPLADHLRHLIVHGVLHLLGYDHEDDADAEAMEAAEVLILAGLGVPDPYGGDMESRG